MFVVACLFTVITEIVKEELFKEMSKLLKNTCKQTVRFHHCSLNSLSTANPSRCWYSVKLQHLGLWALHTSRVQSRGFGVRHCHVRDTDNGADIGGSVGRLWDFAELREYQPGRGSPDSDHHQPRQWGIPPGCRPHQHGGNPAVCYAAGACWCGDSGQETTGSGKTSGERKGRCGMKGKRQKWKKVTWWLRKWLAEQLSLCSFVEMCTLMCFYLCNRAVEVHPPVAVRHFVLPFFSGGLFLSSFIIITSFFWQCLSVFFFFFCKHLFVFLRISSG